jgi:hypothetical protein
MIGNSGIANSGIVTASVFTCSICGEPSMNICAYCTKDACGNHRCERCKRCSDCCECDMPLSAEEAVADIVPEVPAEAAIEPAPPFESSVFAEPGVFAEPSVLTESTSLAEPRDPVDLE